MAGINRDQRDLCRKDSVATFLFLKLSTLVFCRQFVTHRFASIILFRPCYLCSQIIAIVSWLFF